MSVQEVINNLLAKAQQNPEPLKGIKAIYQFNISGAEGGTYQLKVDDGDIDIASEEKYTPQCTIDISDENFLKLVQGNLNPTMAFMTGKVKAKGDLSLAMKLQTILKQYL